ncbi:MAG TPA: hypothetical protein VK530_16730 [Candidatus Acidoferrum sp.]|nr:hypothetical protein [Candidatus Acidoferrum sp.]
MVEVFLRWHRQRARIPVGDAHRAVKWATVGDLLLESLSGPLADAVEAIICASIPTELNEEPVNDVFLTSRLFPLPFLSLPEGLRSSTLVRNASEARSAYRWLEDEEAMSLTEDNTRRLGEAGYIRVCMDVNIGLGAPAVSKSLRIWARKAHENWAKQFPDKAHQMRTPTGRRAITGKNAPWFRLKELAAYRLNRVHGLSWAKATKLLGQYKKAHPAGAHEDVWPNYHTSGGWSDAVNSAAAYLQKKYSASQD